MISYTKYKTATGIITEAGQAQDTNHVLCESDESYIEGFYKPDDYKIENGVAVLSLPVVDNAARFRSKRDVLLSNCDWTQGADSPLTDTKKAEWRVYRTALRDLTSHANWPNLNPADWPNEPS